MARRYLFLAPPPTSRPSRRIANVGRTPKKKAELSSCPSSAMIPPPPLRFSSTLIRAAAISAAGGSGAARRRTWGATTVMASAFRRYAGTDATLVAAAAVDGNDTCEQPSRNDRPPWDDVMPDGNVAGSGAEAATAMQRGGHNSSSNRKLAAVIREGLPRLHQHALQIQACAQTHQPLILRRSRGGDDDGEGAAEAGPAQYETSSSPALSPRQLAEAHRLLDAASDALEHLVRTDPGRGLMISGEPIVLLDAKVHVDLRSAVIYWALPISLLDSVGLGDEDKLQLLVEWFRHQITTPSTPQHAALGKLTRLVSARLRSFRVPKVRWEPADPRTVLAFRHYSRVRED